MSVVAEKIEKLCETDINNTPEDNIFLSEMDYQSLIQSDIHNKNYWVIATKGRNNSDRQEM